MPSIIYLSCLPLCICPKTTKPSQFCPESGIQMYMAFQPARFVLIVHYCTITWALTPHFHPYHAPKLVAVIFCDTMLYRATARSHPLGGAALYVVRTFLFRLPESDRAVYRHKDTIIFLYTSTHFRPSACLHLIKMTASVIIRYAHWHFTIIKPIHKWKTME